MRGMQLEAHLGKFLGILTDVFGVVASGTGKGHLAWDTVKQDAIASVVGDHILSWFGRRDAHVVHLTGQQHLVQRLLDLARVVEFEHDQRIGLVVVALAVESATGEDEVV